VRNHGLTAWVLFKHVEIHFELKLLISVLRSLVLWQALSRELVQVKKTLSCIRFLSVHRLFVRGFPQSLQANAAIVPEFRPRQHISTSFRMYYLLISLPFEAVHT
jgi:hypothetical protein